jgi:ATP/maltotriose-dependent transcriptional regulator MalT
MTDIARPATAEDLISAGTRALAAGAWEESRDYFQAAVAVREDPAALEGLAMAAWWLDDAPVVFAIRERAYRLYRQRGDRLDAARLAIWLGYDHYLYRGNLAPANGWFQRARRLLAGSEPAFEHGFLALIEGHIDLFERHDVASAKARSAETIALAQALGSIDLEMFALALEGLALVREGEVRDGMRQLDEATAAALAGDVSDPDTIVAICCYLIFACERVRDLERAAQWCEKVREYAERWTYRSMFAVCRTHYASVLLWQGDWPQAERQLATARREFMATRPGWGGESVLRLGQLRLRQGQLDDAALLFAQLPGHPLALLGQAEINLERGDTVAAADLVERFFRRVPPGDRTERAVGLELGVRVAVARGLNDSLLPLLAELEAIAAFVETEPLRGAACFARGLVAAAGGDPELARRAYEDAVDAFERGGAPFEAARARLALATVLAATGRRTSAAAEARAALSVFRRLGAAREAERAAALLPQLDVPPDRLRPPAALPAHITRREAEVLGLMAQGYSNQQIAEQFFLSVRTVERHISSIYAKLGATGSTARSVATAFAIQHELVPAPER